ncbi:MAG: type I-A CRISPR-associated protein Cas4/Csa1 [Acidimicrobiia bacterium]
MLLLTEEDRRYLTRGMLPEARSLQVPEDLRGWSWSRPPLEPAYPVRLAVHEIAAQYCETARDLYLRRVAGLRSGPSDEMRRGSELHRVISAAFTTAKARLYAAEKAAPAVLRGLAEKVSPGVDEGSEARTLARHIEDAIVADVAATLSAQPRIESDALVARVVPAVFDVRLDGGVFGLSRHLIADAIAVPWPVVIDFKFGPLRKFHRLATAGYGLAFEATYEVPVNAGVTIAIEFADGRVVVTKDFHVLDADLRQWFIESRDERARLVYHERDPGLADHHPSSCPFLAACGVAATPYGKKEPAELPRVPIARPSGRIIVFPGGEESSEP